MFIFQCIYLLSVLISGSVVLFHSGEFIRALYSDDRKLGGDDIAAFVTICCLFIFLPVMNSIVAYCAVDHYLRGKKQNG